MDALVALCAMGVLSKYSHEKTLRKGGMRFAVHGLVSLGSPSVSRWMRAVNGKMKFGA